MHHYFMNMSNQPTAQPQPNAPLAGRQRFALALLLILALAPRAAHAQATPNPPERLSYQGYVTDATGTALGTNAPKNYDVIFRIYDAQTAGNLKWAEQQTVTVDKGYFSVLLGEGTQQFPASPVNLSTFFAAPDASDRYVEFTVKGIGSGGADVTILPRLRLLTSPYAFLAKNAAALISPNGASLVTSANGQLTVNGAITGDGSGLTALNASQLTTGTLPNGRLSGTYSSPVNLSSVGNSFTGNGSGLTGLTSAQIPNLDASKIASGILSDARLSGNVPRLNAANSFSSAFNSFSGNGASFGLSFYGGGLCAVLSSAGTDAPQFCFLRGSDGRFFDIGQNPSGGFTIEDTDTPRLTITKDGNVGIGTDVPGAQFHVYGGGFPSAVVESYSTAGTWISLRNDSSGGNNWNLISSGSGNGEGAGKLLFNDQTLGGTVMTLTSGGLGIGTAAPADHFHVRGGNIRIDDGGSKYIQMWRSPNGLVFTGNSMGNASGIPSVQWDGDNNWDSLSDIKFKKDIVDAEPVLEHLMQVRVRRFRWKDAEESAPKKFGVIAQELQPVFPDSVGKMLRPGDSEESLTVKYGSFGLIAVKALQEFKQQQDSEMTKLKAQLVELAQENAALAAKNKENDDRLVALERLVHDHQRQTAAIGISPTRDEN